ncbi:hypothetical protein LAZ67_15000711 [Cordylochernes scorpioides]|uniref:Uncharacterized protein n=1 Tax=Cordylochernes scorpioides TaxID=51811 RepID=A0ABY6L8A4_9ARAC|nr:hypothetical protein LAZ67_15000711 [Cordylochernes scorpioides]
MLVHHRKAKKSRRIEVGEIVLIGNDQKKRISRPLGKSGGGATWSRWTSSSRKSEDIIGSFSSSREKIFYSDKRGKCSPIQMEIPSFGLKYRPPSRVDIPKIIAGVEPAISSLPHTTQCTIRQSISQVLRKPTPQSNLSLGKYRSLRSLRQNSQIMVTRSDKGSQTIILDTDDYTSKMMDILSDQTTFIPITKLDISSSTRTFRLKLLRLKKSGSITSEQYQTFTSDMTNSPYIYGLPKTHKPTVPLRPIIAYHLSPRHTNFLNTYQPSLHLW